MQITFITVKRQEENYVFNSVESLLNEYKDNKSVHVFVGNNDIEYIEEFCARKQINLHSFDKDQMRQLQQLSTMQKAMLNGLAAVSFDCNEDILFCEDDIIFKDGWLLALQNLIRLTNNNKIICLYSNLKHESKNEYIELKTPLSWNQWGLTLCVYMPSNLRKQFAEILENVYRQNTALDNEMQSFCNSMTSIILTNPSYVNHTGMISTIDENKCHGPRLSPMF